MSILSRLGAVLLLCVAGIVHADDAAPTGDQANAAETKKTVEFDGQTLVLAYEADSDGDTIQEFIPADETLDSWTSLAAVREHAELDDPQEFAEKVVEQLEKRDPPANYELLANPNTGEVILNFIVWPEDLAYAEFNLFRYRPKEGGGLTSYQYALRAYGDDKEKFIAGMDAEKRAKLIAAIIEMGAHPSE
ncbi:MAG TPA: hypothetical protein VGG64_06375 [Pirellulales bacterium]|jgi:hypothetical protein